MAKGHHDICEIIIAHPAWFSRHLDSGGRYILPQEAPQAFAQAIVDIAAES